MTVAAPHTLLNAVALQLANGVAVFFVISGFVLYRPWVASRHGQSRRPAIRTYLRRRCLRIFPAYWLALTVLTLAFSLPDVFSHNWWRYYGLLQVYDPHTTVNGMRVAWTLCVEISFYAVLPLYAMLADRIARTFKRELLLLIGLAAIPLGWQLMIAYGAAAPYTAETLLGTFDWFALGMTLAILSVRRTQIPTWVTLLACAASFSLLVAFPDSLPNHIAAGLFAASVVSLAVLTPNPPQFLAWKPLAWLGVISYGIYLWHATLIPPVIHHVGMVNFATVTIATAILTTVIAALSYYLFERRIMAWGEWRPGSRKSGPIAEGAALEHTAG
jgi:peptidoglycan/LPS O-acetylase OafA/YrhL